MCCIAIYFRFSSYFYAINLFQFHCDPKNALYDLYFLKVIKVCVMVNMWSFKNLLLYLIYNVLSVSAVHQNDPVIHLCTYLCTFFFFFFFFVFLGPCLWHMEVPRLGGKLELQLLAYASATAMPDPKLHL